MTDVEHQKYEDAKVDETVVEDTSSAGGAIDEKALAEKHGSFLRWCYTLGVEARGVERVPESERSTKHSAAILLFWISVNTVLTTIPIGTLVSVFGLTYKQGVACIIGFSTAFVATLGPFSGMRTMVITRYSFGVWGTPLIIVLNVVTQLGFEVIALIVGGQTLHAVGSGNLPLTVGIIIIGVVTVLICVFGYNLINWYERFAFVVAVFLFCVLYGLGARAEGGYDVNAGEDEALTGADLSGSVLSMASVMAGSTLGWTAIAADYNVHLPPTYSKRKIWFATWLGLTLAISFGSVLGATLLTISDPAYTSAYEDGGIGSLIHQVFSVWNGFGEFLTVLAALTVIANGIPNTYSSALSAQALHPICQKIPRVVWVLLAFVAYTAAAEGGRDHFEEYLNNALPLFGYWNAGFVVVLIQEHYLFRRSLFGRPPLINGGYDLSVYDKPKQLPYGFAALFAFACCVGGFVVGMDQTYYVGPLAAKIGTYGGDLGFWLASGFCAIAYPPARLLELHLFGR